MNRLVQQLVVCFIHLKSPLLNLTQIICYYCLPLTQLVNQTSLFLVTLEAQNSTQNKWFMMLTNTTKCNLCRVATNKWGHNKELPSSAFPVRPKTFCVSNKWILASSTLNIIIPLVHSHDNTISIDPNLNDRRDNHVDDEENDTDDDNDDPDPICRLLILKLHWKIFAASFLFHRKNWKY